ncbi:hypothetical protein [Bartonella sp. MU37NMGALS]
MWARRGDVFKRAGLVGGCGGAGGAGGPFQGKVKRLGGRRALSRWISV